MNNKNIKVIDEHNIDRNANVMFAMDLNGSEYVVYWIERDETSNNVFVSKVLKNLDGTYNMLNIDDADKKKEISEVVKFLISSSVSDQNDKLAGTTKTLSTGEVVKFVSVSFNKEQNINVPKTYITTVKKEVTKVVGDYYDIVSSETEIENVLTPVVNTDAPAVDTVVVKPEIVEPITNVVSTPVEVPVVEPISVNVESVVAAPAEVAATPELPKVETPSVVESQVVPPVVPVMEPVVTIPTPVETPVVSPVTEVVTPVMPTVEVKPEVAVTTPVVETTTSTTEEPFFTAPAEVSVMPEVPVVNNTMTQTNEVKTDPVTPIIPTPVVTETLVNTTNVEAQPLVFNAAKETNLNAALGEVASSSTIPVENITVVREFGEEAPVAQKVEQPVVAQMVQSNSAVDPKVVENKGGFANSKFFMVVAIAFFMASCVFLGYEVYKYFQIVNK